MLEKIITLITALIASLDANTAALKGAPSAAAATGETAAQKKAREKAEKEAAAGANAGTTAPTATEVRAAATAFLDTQKDDAKQKEFMSTLNAKYGTQKRITEVSPDKFPEIIATLNAEVARLKAGAVAPAASASEAI